MNTRTGALLLAGLAILSGCATQAPKQAEAESEQTVVIRASEEMPEGSRSCRVGFDMIYPADIVVHKREVRYRMGREIEPGTPPGALREQGGAVEIPRPINDPRPDRSDPERVVFRVSLNSFSPCIHAQMGSEFLATVEFVIGDCVEGDCPPYRYEPPAGETTAVLRLAE